MTATEKILVRQEGRVGFVTFNNPARHNAVSLEMWEAMAHVLQDFAHDANVRAVVLRGAGGKAFASGADISRFEKERADEAAIRHYSEAVERAHASIYAFPKPTIAMIQGYCIGGGLGIALCCDIRIATEQSRFAVPAAKLGLGYEFPGLKRLADVVGLSFAKEIFFTARQFDAEEARAMGLVNRIVAAAEIEAYVARYADMIANNAPLTIEAVKFTLNEVVKDPAQRDPAHCAELVRRCFASNDYHEGRKAFLEKRPPAFTGT